MTSNSIPNSQTTDRELTLRMIEDALMAYCALTVHPHSGLAALESKRAGYRMMMDSIRRDLNDAPTPNRAILDAYADELVSQCADLADRANRAADVKDYSKAAVLQERIFGLALANVQFRRILPKLPETP